MTDANKQAALDYHAKPIPGKLSVELTKPTATARDLALAYSPGVAEPVREIAREAENAYRYTGKGNLVAVISDGSAILGLGNLGPLASKPVMEGKGVLFKCFAGINSVDIEVDAESPQAFIDTVARIADTWGGINLEDIKAPECFEIEKTLVERCNIPVFHDDQHGTAIVTAAGMLNALDIAGKRIEDVKIVCMGAGAAAIACMRLLISCGAKKENLVMLDRRGVIHTERAGINAYNAEFARDTAMRTLDEEAPYTLTVNHRAGGPEVHDEMVRQMLAADELPEATPETLRATGFLARNYYLFNRNTWLDATIEHTGKAFLGLTINCARCHDPMNDPVAKKDYYRFRAIFEPHQIRTDPIDGRLDVANHGISLAYDAKPKTPTYLFERGNDKRPDKDNPLTASVPSFLPGQQLKVSPVELSPIIFYPGLREPIREGLLETARRLVSSRTAAVTKLESPADSPGSEESEPRELAVARKELTAARAQLESLTARVTADTARYHGNDPVAAATAASLAAARHRQSDLIAAEAGVLRAELSKAQAKAGSDKKKISASSDIYSLGCTLY